LLRFVADRDDGWPLEILERKELEKVLGEGIRRLPQVERTVLALYFKEELTLREIARVVGLHESRISQLKSQAILRLRGYLKARWPGTGERRTHD
jgi:RNA polymerase sigma factor for flagellar operon FliA